MKVLVRVPLSNDAGRPSAETAEALVSLAQSEFPMDKGKPIFRRGGSTWANRERFGQEVRGDSSASHLFMVDSDIGFTPDQALRLLQHRKSVVAGVYGHHAKDVLLTGELADAGSKHLAALAGDLGFEGWMPVPGQGLEVRTFAAPGFMLIAREVFEKVEPPWFAHIHEDVFFCRRLRDAGVRLWVDYGCRVGHVTSMWR